MTASFDRRAMLAGGLAASAATLMPLSQAFAQRRGRVSANDKVQVGVIGCKGMGWADLTAMIKGADVTPVALCDVDLEVLSGRGRELQQASGRAPRLYGDYRRMLDDQNVDAVIIGTPDHWHALQLTDAMSAGKDVYCEKPLGNSIAECRAMVAAKQRHGRVVQVGQWQRSNRHWADAIAHVQSGGIGRVRKVKAWAYMGWMKNIAPKPDQAPPEGVDYDRWLGPAAQRAFNPNRFHFNWRWYWDYAGGLMTDWGVHLIDIALLGMKAQTPKSISSLGGAYAYPDSAMETPDTQTAIYDFGDFSVEWEHAVGISRGPYDGHDHGVAFVGETGTLIVDRSKWWVTPETSDGKPMTREVPVTKASDSGLDRHTADFIACVKDRARTPACPIESAANTAIVCQMGNVAWRTGRKLHWDNAGGQFKGDAEANALITPRYRAPYRLPA
ncbi:Gfo/Idh/MocA family protein [Sphingosinicella sp. BN140058]|uniref:Gfo/Idh/MocA family protein n=1 Tax=Sphingosinicella sp. BN140058 TaxID=1892855 RepID=UPI001010318F|nr:Gfo/Idh/MocA family oxidoreductase [Sphingosinicella sp. BN140058]QAY75560.1 Gfo/Idh/MocA family oxidoreductase [Sphingosinicella sp. BN140058]